MMKSFFTYVLVLAVTCFHETTAWPSGAGGCAGGMAAVGGSHSSRAQTKTGSLSDGMLNATLTSGDVVLPLDGPSIAIEPDVNYTLTVTGSQFRGFLIRLDGGLELVETDSSLTAVAGVCESPVLGLTHMDNSPKTAVSAVLSVLEPASLDITIVLANNADLSEYYYSGFTLQSNTVDPNPARGGGPDFDCVDDAETGGYNCLYTGESSFPFSTPNSYLRVDCMDDISLGLVEPTAASCTCEVFIGTPDDVNNTKACDSCAFVPTETDTELLWEIEYDCARLLHGPCVGRIADGNCTASVYDVTVDVVVDSVLGVIPVQIDTMDLLEGETEEGTLNFDDMSGDYTVTLVEATNDSATVVITFSGDGFADCDFSYAVTVSLNDSGVGQSEKETVETCSVLFSTVVVDAQITVMRN